MPILIRNGSGTQTVAPGGFSNEEELERLLAGSPDLLWEDQGPAIAFVDRQVDLREAGILDLLFVTGDGLPIAVEVKLARNAQARREVVAQAIDYLSSLTALTVDELDERVGGRLDTALRTLTAGNDTDFERVWLAVGANLRAGLARLAVVLDDAPSPLERIFRFLARNSQLDVQLFTIQRYPSPGIGDVFVPRSLLSAASEDKSSAPTGSRAPYPELPLVVNAYNESVTQEVRAVGGGANYRPIRLAEWPGGMRTHYEFYQTRSYIGAELHIESESARPLATRLSQFAGKNVADGQGTLVWDRNWSSGRGRLVAQFPPSTPPQVVAHAMRDLVSMTRAIVTKELNALAPDRE
jgi:hypothetical protein